MKLSDNVIQEFQKIYLKKFGVVLSINQANKKGLELLNFFELIYRPIPAGKIEQTINKYLVSTDLFRGPKAFIQPT